MKLLLIFLVLFAFAAFAQDVSVPKDLLGTTTSVPNVTDIVDVEYSEETTNDEVEDTTVEVDSNWGEDNSGLPPPDSLVRPQFPSVTPIPLPAFESNCTIQLPPNYHPSNLPPIVIPPIVNSTIDPVEREETLICPVGSKQVGSVCNITFSNECPESYTFNGERCVIKFTNCPLNFEMNESGQCVERQLCPHNHIWRNERCQPMTNCPNGWRWNGERCEVIRVECQPGSVLRGNECVSESFLCPIGFDQIGDNCIQPKLLCPPGYEMKSSGFCSQVTLRCPSGSAMINGECRRTVISCPEGTHQVGNQCYQVQTERPTCPPGFQLVGNMCNLIPTQKPPGFECPPGTVKLGNACYYLPNSTEKPGITCPPGFYVSGDRCVPIQTPPTHPSVPPPECPEGFYRQGNACYPNTLPVPRPPIFCPPGFFYDGTRCNQIPSKPCPPEYYEENGRCYPIGGREPWPETSTPRLVYPPTNAPGHRRCPDGFEYHNHQCYRCPPDFILCENKCIRSGHSCGGGSYPNININIFSRDNRATGKIHNIINQIEPINNTIVNFNNVTHPVTLNNVVENNIHIYNDVQCPDGSIRTIIVKNNETVNGCLDVDTSKDSENKPTDIDDVYDEENEKCCEIVTPRQCKKRDSNGRDPNVTGLWICTHR
jgi:hypothetical protein